MVTSATSMVPDGSRSLAPAVTVVSVPASHPYVARISSAAGIDLHPDPPVPGAPAGVWWPPVVLDPEWIERNGSAAQLLHIHFGTESFSPAQLRACIEAARRVGWPVVFTVHDLEHPQLDDQETYLPQLDELVTGADAVVTLTDGAAASVRSRWGRDAMVIPHPSLRDPDAAPPRVRASDETPGRWQ